MARRWSASRCSRLRSPGRARLSRTSPQASRFRATSYDSRRDAGHRPAGRPAAAELRDEPVRLADVAVVLNQLDGFNVQPTDLGPFSAPIDLSTVSSSSIFLAGPGGKVVGINQVVWEPPQTRSTSRATSSSRRTRRTCSSSRRACGQPAARRSRRRVSATTSTGQTRIPRRRRTARHCSTPCRWRWSAEPSPRRSRPPASSRPSRSTPSRARSGRSCRRRR